MLALVGAGSLVFVANAQAVASDAAYVPGAAAESLGAGIGWADVQVRADDRARGPVLGVALAGADEGPPRSEPGSTAPNTADVLSRAVGFGQLLVPDVESASPPPTSESEAPPSKKSTAVRQPLRPTPARAQSKAAKRHAQKARPSASSAHQGARRKAVQPHQPARSRAHKPAHPAPQSKTRSASPSKVAVQAQPPRSHAVPTSGATAVAAAGLQAAAATPAAARSASSSDLPSKSTPGVGAAESIAQRDAPDQARAAEPSASTGAASTADWANAPAAPTAGAMSGAERASGSAPQVRRSAAPVPDPVPVDSPRSEGRAIHAVEQTSLFRRGWPWVLAILLLALAGIFATRRRRAAPSATAVGGTAEGWPQNLRHSTTEDFDSESRRPGRTANADGATALPDGEAPEAESAPSPPVAEPAPVEPLQAPMADAAGGAAAIDGSVHGDAYYRDFAYTIELPPQPRKSPGGGDARLARPLADKLAAARALRASGHADEAASQAHEILQVCEALDAELQALNRRIQSE